MFHGVIKKTTKYTLTHNVTRQKNILEQFNNVVHPIKFINKYTTLTHNLPLMV